jgi:predicted ester cyclase
MLTRSDLTDGYRAYIACLNERDWERLGKFVADEVTHNGRRLGLAGYRAMLERDVDEVPDLRFEVEFLVVDPPYVAARLAFDCTPTGTFMGLAVNGRRVRFCENVFYQFRAGKIVDVRSVIDKVAIEAQL